MKPCRFILRHLLWIFVLLSILSCFPTDPEYPNANIENPPSIYTFFINSTDIALDRYGYVPQEFFFSGTAKSYKNTSEMKPDGKWEVAPARRTTYKSRMLIYRPVDPDKFNGTVLVEWLNVTEGADTAAEWVFLHNEIMRRGYAWVGVSAQQIAIEGGETPLPPQLGATMHLKCIVPFRYNGLSHPGDSFSYDIFSQAARAIRHPLGIAPLGELQIERMIAIGQSQSAAYLMTFINAFGKTTDLFDGYYIHSRLGNNPDLRGASAPLSQPPQAYIPAPPVVIVREDLQIPVMNVQTETDLFVLDAYHSRQADSDTFRLWEVAGAAHADNYILASGMTDNGDVPSAKIVVTDKPKAVVGKCPEPINSAPQHHFVANAALQALNRWLVDGTLPRTAPRLAVNESGDGFVYDAFGNVLGGVRSPYVDAPIARFSGENASVRNDMDTCFIEGTTQMLDEATLRALYSDHDAYVAAVTAAANQATENGFLVQEDAELIIRAAEASDIPPLD